MGCFLSKNQPTKAQSKKCGQLHPPALPPPPPVEEETVKEVVLSETPILKVPIPIEEKVRAHEKLPGNQELEEVESMAEIKSRGLTAEIKLKAATVQVKPSEDLISEISEQSEFCSYTESFSTTATATAPEKRDDGEEVTQKSPIKPRRKRPNNGDMIGTRERTVRSPARRPAPSPEKRKPVQGRGMPGPRTNLGGPRREGSEVSARRSRSPVTRGSVWLKSPGMNETGKTIGRSPARAVENIRGRNEVKNDGVPPESMKVEKLNDNVCEEVSESLENPLVSLECFIFL